jgi:hypothetical protein
MPVKEGGKQKKSKKSIETYKIYIYKVLKQVRTQRIVGFSSLVSSFFSRMYLFACGCWVLI